MAKTRGNRYETQLERRKIKTIAGLQTGFRTSNIITLHLPPLRITLVASGGVSLPLVYGSGSRISLEYRTLSDNALHR
ncbi:hypothetical protein [Candidatus Steffania adelgidicola]|uniref:hypothetical protein n=1 Tax=Candidatus Steffania adelgidicola TaxID=1076626 RepID=UPI001D0084AE|nr:hypothetical protein [Candidatus Steffania adelgidicola]